MRGVGAATAGVRVDQRQQALEIDRLPDEVPDAEARGELWQVFLGGAEDKRDARKLLIVELGAPEAGVAAWGD